MVSADNTPVERMVAGVETIAGGQLISVGGSDRHIIIAVGLATDGIETITGSAELVREADAALSTAIEEGLAVVVGDGTRSGSVAGLKNLATRIAASSDTDFRPFYQPIVALPDGRLAGQEMVLRWRPTDDEWVLPEWFMSVAEDTGRILAIGTQIIGCAIAEHVATWGRGPDMPFLSVNLSRRQMLEPDLVGEIVDALVRNRLPAEKLWIEVSEKQIIDLDGQALTTLEELRRHGCVICVDDLGAGFSALSYLWDLPAGVVKLDRSLIRGLLSGDPARAEFVDCICRLATTAGASIVAEGVEDPAVLPILADLGVEYAQGFHFGPPAPAGAAPGDVDEAGPADPDPDQPGQ